LAYKKGETYLSNLITALWGPEDSGRLRLPDSVTSALEGGRLSAICTGRLTPISILVLILTLSLLMLYIYIYIYIYIYGAPCKSRNLNVVYIYIYIYMDQRLATLKALVFFFYLLQNVSTLNQRRKFSCGTVVCKHLASYQGYPTYRWDLIWYAKS
jgi:hypothetical protein